MAEEELQNKNLIDTSKEVEPSQNQPRIDMLGRGKTKVDPEPVEAEDSGIKDSQSKSRFDEDEALTPESSARKRKLAKGEDSPAGEHVKAKKAKKQGKRKGRKLSKKRSSKKSKSSAKKDEEKDVLGVYEVEKILQVKLLKNGKKEFLIHWKGFSSEFDTWEPEANLDCKDLVNEFFKEHKEASTTSKGRNEGSQKRKKAKAPSRRSSRSTRSKQGSRSKKRSGKKAKSSKKKSGSAGAKSKKERSVAAEDKKADEGNNKESEGKKILQKVLEAEDVDDPTDGEDEREYEVERILNVRYLRDGTRQFLIKWKGFAKKFNSWEPEANLNCTAKLEKFLRNKEQSVSARVLRVNRKRTDRFSVENKKNGRKWSLRLLKLPRRSYSEMD